MPQRTVRPQGTRMSRQRDKWRPPGQHPAQPLQHTRQVGTPRTTPSAATVTHAVATPTASCVREGEPAARGRRGRPRGSGRGPRAASAGRGDGTSRRRCLRPGCSEPPSSEAAKVEGWRIPGLPVHTAVRIETTPPEIQGTSKRLYLLRVPTEDLCTPAGCGTAQNAKRTVMLTRSPASRAALSGR